MIPVVDMHSGTGEPSAAAQGTLLAPTARRPLRRAAEIAAGVVAYAIAGLSTCLITLGSTLAIWGLWQWLGVN